MGRHPNPLPRVTHPLVVKLEEIRVARGLTGGKMAELLGVHPSSWSRMVNEGMQPNIDLIPVAAREFPEIRFFVVERLLISTSDDVDQQATDRVAV